MKSESVTMNGLQSLLERKLLIFFMSSSVQVRAGSTSLVMLTHKAHWWSSKNPQAVYEGKNVMAALSGLYDTDACWHILSLLLTEFTPSSPEALHAKQA
jgi:hypothetical protein